MIELRQIWNYNVGKIKINHSTLSVSNEVYQSKDKRFVFLI